MSCDLHKLVQLLGWSQGMICRVTTSCMMYTYTIVRFAPFYAGSLRIQRLSTMRIEAKKGSKAAGKAVAKSNLPSKVCIVCNRPFTW